MLLSPALASRQSLSDFVEQRTCSRVGGIQRERCAQMFARFLYMSLGQQQPAERAVRARQLWVQAERFRELGDRLVDAAEIDERHGIVMVSLGEARIVA